jgi:hypothetical protein
MISLVRYWLNNDIYLANAFTIFANDSPNVIMTTEGIECDAFFEKAQLRPSTYRNSLSIDYSLADGRKVQLIKVRVKISYTDIWGIHTEENGQTISLFLDQAAMIRGMTERRPLLTKEDNPWTNS